MNSLPTPSPDAHPHADIAQYAHQLWQSRGCPTGCDDEIWLEAERKLGRKPKGDPFGAATHASTVADNLASYQVSPAQAEKEAITLALQKHEARAPQTAHHSAPHSKPAVTGKPVWPKPHSN
ncbi:hypothetical protein Verru16b_02555 [Lacunisphaera limnophila]|uniref:DUF2934 domain-containing protein n=1 Tax=Lacunisphaera limnophila TaxID=1838286 RepID=A0A1D8AX46_9BACT|nr:DUF2934 domain-containing protein [Lacunisphaera limnophila]AOS45474.1 hypothetical protein Verru16b_02555 [Lacunisphaera limnophila]